MSFSNKIYSTSFFGWVLCQCSMWCHVGFLRATKYQIRLYQSHLSAALSICIERGVIYHSTVRFLRLLNQTIGDNCSGNGLLPSGIKPLVKQCWPRSTPPYGITGPLWVKELSRVLLWMCEGRNMLSPSMGCGLFCRMILLCGMMESCVIKFEIPASNSK